MFHYFGFNDLCSSSLHTTALCNDLLASAASAVINRLNGEKDLKYDAIEPGSFVFPITTDTNSAAFVRTKPSYPWQLGRSWSQVTMIAQMFGCKFLANNPTLVSHLGYSPPPCDPKWDKMEKNGSMEWQPKMTHKSSHKIDNWCAVFWIECSYQLGYVVSLPKSVWSYFL